MENGKTKNSKIDNISNIPYIRTIPRDYLEYGKEKNADSVVNAILLHVGQAKKYSS